MTDTKKIMRLWGQCTGVGISPQGAAAWVRQYNFDSLVSAIRDLALWVHGERCKGNIPGEQSIFAEFGRRRKYLPAVKWTDRSPIRLVRQSAKRLSTPDVLTADEIGKPLAMLDGIYFMAFLAAVTGLCVSELLALRWEDVDFDSAEIHLIRAIVCQHVGLLKTAASQKPVPMDASLAALLLDWRGRCPYNQSTDYVFTSAEMHGKQPL